MSRRKAAENGRSHQANGHKQMDNMRVKDMSIACHRWDIEFHGHAGLDWSINKTTPCVCTV